MNIAQPAITVVLLMSWVVVLLRRDRFVLPGFATPSIKLTHVLPAILQIVLFAYWSIYWSGVSEHLPVLVAQLGVAYAMDFLLAWTLRQPYSASVGPVPIVLSANLFVWFRADDFLLYVLVIAAALGSKTFLRWGERHVFNPSVLGVSVVGLLCILLPSIFHYQDISHDFSRPPLMAQVIILLALIPQIRLGTAPVALGCAVAMIGVMLTIYSLIGYRGGPSPWWPPWLLAITLLAGDPATIPSTATSRLLFGLFLGMAFYVVSRVLLLSVGTDFFAKVLPIPMANVLVPSFERTATRLSARWPSLARAVGNRAYVAAWLLLSAFMFALPS